MPASSQSVCRLCTDVVPTLRGRCVDVVQTLCAPTVCQVLIVCRCCVDVVRSTHEMCADVVWTLCGRFEVKRPTSRFCRYFFIPYIEGPYFASVASYTSYRVLVSRHILQMEAFSFDIFCTLHCYSVKFEKFSIKNRQMPLAHFSRIGGYGNRTPDLLHGRPEYVPLHHQPIMYASL